MDNRQYFDVDPHEKDEFTAAAGGRARWDPAMKRYYMLNDDLRNAPDKKALAQWRPPHVGWPAEDADTSLTVYAVPHECVRCKLSSLAVVGFSIDDDPESEGIVDDATAGPALKLVADALTEVNDESIHRYAEQAHFRRRFSGAREELYFANCCRNLDCETIFGENYLHKKLIAADANGSLIQVARVRVPRYLVDKATSDYQDN